MAKLGQHMPACSVKSQSWSTGFPWKEMHRSSNLSARSSQELFSSDGSAWGYSAALLAALFTALALLCVRTLTVLGEPAHHAREAFHWGNLCGSLALGLPRGLQPLEASRCFCSWCYCMAQGEHLWHVQTLKIVNPRSWIFNGRSLISVPNVWSINLKKLFSPVAQKETKDDQHVQHGHVQ